MVVEHELMLWDEAFVVDAAISLMFFALKFTHLYLQKSGLVKLVLLCPNENWLFNGNVLV